MTIRKSRSLPGKGFLPSRFLTFSIPGIILLLAASFMISLPANAGNLSALAKQGRNKAQNCTRCHGRLGIQKAAERAGMGTTVGKFAQRELMNFRAGLRQHVIMSGVATTLTDKDIEAISAWLDSIQNI